MWQQHRLRMAGQPSLVPDRVEGFMAINLEGRL